MNIPITLDVELEMVCSCSPEGAAKGEALRQRCHQLLEAGSDELVTRTVTERDWLQDFVLSLSVDLHGHIDSILTDQWSAVTILAWRPWDTHRTQRVRVSAMCDDVVQGLSACYLALHDWRHDGTWPAGATVQEHDGLPQAHAVAVSTATERPDTPEMDAADERRRGVIARHWDDEDDELSTDVPRCTTCNEPLLNEGRVCLEHGEQP